MEVTVFCALLFLCVSLVAHILLWWLVVVGDFVVVVVDLEEVVEGVVAHVHPFCFVYHLFLCSNGGKVKNFKINNDRCTIITIAHKNYMKLWKTPINCNAN